MVLTQCLTRYDRTEANKLTETSQNIAPVLTANVNGSQANAGLAPRLDMSPPLPYRMKSETRISKIATLGEPLLPSQRAKASPSDSSVSTSTQVLIVDDNAINRRLLAAFMKKRKYTFKEAKDGLQALKTYKEAEGRFDNILMDISMPVMDGMTSTRFIREHESNLNFKPAHIIALTGLTSASAKLEAWTSGVDDFLTKPVDFEKLESLMKAGRGEEGTGFLGDQEPKRQEEDGSQEAVKQAPT